MCGLDETVGMDWFMSLETTISGGGIGLSFGNGISLHNKSNSMSRSSVVVRLSCIGRTFGNCGSAFGDW